MNISFSFLGKSGRRQPFIFINMLLYPLTFSALLLSSMSQPTMETNSSKVVIYQLKDLTPLEDFKFRCIFDFKKAKMKLYDIKNSKKQLQIIEVLYNFLNSDRQPKHLLHCLHIIDFMIQFPCYYAAIEKYLAQFYYSIFRWIYNACDTKAIEQAKVIRKYWLGKIDYSVYISIKKAVEYTFDISLELINPEAVNNIKCYYQNVLKLTQEQLECHLPQAKSSNSTIKFQQDSKGKPKKKSAAKLAQEQLRKMEEMNIGLLYREYVKAQKERIKKEKKNKQQSKPKGKQKNQDKPPKLKLQSKTVSQPTAKMQEKIEKADKVKIEEELPGKRLRQRTFQIEQPQITTQKRFIPNPPSPTKPPHQTIATTPSKSIVKLRSNIKGKHSKK